MEFRPTDCHVTKGKVVTMANYNQDYQLRNVCNLRSARERRECKSPLLLYWNLSC